MCRELRKKDILSEVLRLSHDRSLNKYADVDDEDDFQVRAITTVPLCFLFVSVNTTNFDPSHHGPVDKMMKSGSGRASADNASHHLPAYTCFSRLLTVQGELLHIILLPRVH